MRKVHQENGYLFYIGTTTIKGGSFQMLYNIVPEPKTTEEKLAFKEPESGYPNRQYIERIKGIKFPDRYQPTLHGMKELYSS